MKNLLIKDIMFNKKPLVIGIGLSIILSAFCAFKGQGDMYIFYVLSVFLMCFYCLNKIFYSDERDKTIYFFKMLPIKLNDIVLSKFIENISFGIFAILLELILNIFFKSIKVNYYILPIDYAIIIISISSIFSAVFTTVFFKKNYSTAQNSLYVVAVFMFVILFLITKYPYLFAYINKHMNIFSMVILLIAIIINIILYNLLVKYFRYKTI